MIVDLEHEVNTLEEMLDKAVKYHQAGEIAEAERLYRKILQVHVNQPHAHHNLGILALDAKQAEFSLPHFRAALEAAPNEPQFWTSYIEALIEAGKLDAASTVLEHGLRGGLQGEKIEFLATKLIHARHTQDTVTPSLKESKPSVTTKFTSEKDLPKKITAKKTTKPTQNKNESQSEQNITSPSVDAMNTLVNLFNQGLIEEAESQARQMTDEHPHHGFGWKVLGAILQKQGLISEAIEAMREAAALLPTDAEAQCNLGATLKEAGLLAEAEACHHRAIEINPNFASAHYNLGNALLSQNRYQEAAACYQRVIEINPQYVAAYNNLGNALKETEQLSQAEQYFRLALALHPHHLEALSNLGATLREQGKFAEAEPYLRRALELDPNHIEVYCNLSLTLIELGRQFEARALYEKAKDCIPSSAESFNSLGNVYAFLSMYKEAEANYKQATLLKPNFINAHANLANTQIDLGMFKEAEASYREVIKLKPDHYKAYSSMLFALTHVPDVDADFIFKEECEFGKRYEVPLIPFRKALTNDKNPNRQLKIGFLSPDLHHGHPVVYFVEPIIEALAKYTDISLHAYYSSPIEDSVSTRLQKHFKSWHEVVNLSNQALADKIQNDGIDILVELTGHTSAHRLLTCALKPAPIQASWVGYPGSTGLQAMDYFFSDAFILPAGQFDHHFTEKIVHLPACAPFLPPKDNAQIKPLPALKNGFVTFGSFNRISKLNANIIALWAEVLKAVPDSQMLLAAMPDDESHTQITDWFAEAGINKERLSFYKRASMVDYLNLHRQVDICLDTFPFNGGTTTWHALWMGVPTITLAGDALPGRNGAGILSCVGLADFVAYSKQEFVQRAVDWSQNLEALANIRLGLRASIAQSPAGQPELIAQGMERAFRIMWQRWCNDLAPISFASDAPMLEMQSIEDKVEIKQATPNKASLSKKNKAIKNKHQDHAPSFAAMASLAQKFNEGEYALAESLALKMTERYAEHGFAWKILGVTYEQQGRIADALRAMRKAAQLLGDDTEAHYNLGNILNDQALQDPTLYNEAIAAYQHAIKIKPNFAEAHYNLAGIYSHLNQLEKAAASYESAARFMPNNAVILNNLANVLSNLGKLSEAEKNYRNAIACQANFIEAHFNLANTLGAQHKYAEAAASYQQAIALNPQYTEAYSNLANILRAQGDLENAINCYQKALATNPNFVSAYNNLGATLKDLGRLADAENAYRTAIALQPNYALAYYNLGILLDETNRSQEAEQSFKQAIAINANYADAYNNLGNNLRAQGRMQEAEASMRRAIEINPECVPAHNNLGNVLADINLLDAAEASYRQALALSPDYDDAHYNLGKVLADKGDVAQAELSYQQAIALNPNFANAYNNLGNLAKDQGKLKEAEAYYRKAIALNPEFAGGYSNLLFNLTHDETISMADLYAEHLNFSQLYEVPLLSNIQAHRNSKDIERTLKVGFVSGDLRNHAVANFIEPVLKHLAQDKGLELYAYSNFANEDDVTQRLKAHFKHWQMVARMPESTLAEQIRHDEVDVLIDLSGHTAHNRLVTFAHKPAPIQASWIGYPGTTGLQGMDYFLSDQYILPKGQFEAQFTEQIVRLPACAPFMPFEHAPEVSALPALSNRYITFASFNRPSKISASVVALWSALLKAVPSAKLMMAAMPKNGNYSQLIEWFKDNGIAENRLSFHERTDMAGYLKLHQSADICLDTFPYNGGTTTWHALWMGLPTLTLAGNMLPSRNGAAIQGYLGLDDFVSHTAAEFVAKGVKWAANISVLANIRAEMRERFSTSPAQPEPIAEGLSRAIRIMWQRWCEGLKAESFSTATETAQQQKAVQHEDSNMKPDTLPSEAVEQALIDLFIAKRYDELEAQVEALVAQHPHWLTGWKILTDTLMVQDKDARQAAIRATELNPDDPREHCYCGIVLKKYGDLRGAAKCYQRAIELKPDYAEAYNNLGIVRKDLGELEAGVACYQHALELNPAYQDCFSNLLFCLSHAEGLDAHTLFAQHQLFGEHYETPLKATWQAHTNTRDPERNLKIGFVSADFRDHSLAFFIEPLLIHLSKFAELSLIGYFNSSLEDSTTQRLRGKFKYWNDITHLSDEAFANKVREDGVDILIDLSGHTSGNRLLAFARKPAPIQASWLGYLCTTGLTSIDYYFGDSSLLPAGKFDDQFTEKIVQLPANAPFLPSNVAPDVNALPAEKNGFITFACFNRPNKITASVVTLWSKLLRELPNSKMLLGGMPEDGSYDRVIEWFANSGISRERLIFHPRSFMKNYLTLHHEVDICLDTFPSNGVTTTCHAVWMGVPTIAINGTSMASRGAMAVMHHVDLDSFIAEDDNDFVAKGVYWANNIKELAQVRASLRSRFEASALNQPERIAQGLLSAFRTMWKTWCADAPVQSFEVTLPEPTLTTKAVENRPIYVTQPLLAPLEEFVPYLEKIWSNKVLTNGGPFHQQLEQALCEYLGVNHVALFANGTLALLTALQALRVTGEVITTPYSFVATAHSLLWNGIKPVFVDIDPVSLNMDPSKIEAAITPETTAIMPVHCYGHPCDVERIQQIADNYNLKVIYDAAHSFGVRNAGGSILNHGDLSILSLHATKVFNTFEGGAIICPDAKTKHRIDHLKNFGFVDETTVVASGINGKMSEINAAFGLLQLKGIDEALAKRKVVDEYYRKHLAGIQGIHCVSDAGEKTANYSYFPILVQADYPMSRDALYQKMRDAGVYARRYFYPLISDFPMYRGLPSAAQSNLPNAQKAANEVICLPIYPDLQTEQLDRIIALIKG